MNIIQQTGIQYYSKTTQQINLQKLHFFVTFLTFKVKPNSN